MPLVSIIIPVYNVDAWLRRAMDSLIAQEYSHWECICVDDGSTDSSAGILDEYKLRDKRFKVIHQANAGVSIARQVGLDNATGEWIGFLDPDDWIDSSYLAQVVRETSLDSVDMVWTDFLTESEGKTVRSTQKSDGKAQSFIRATFEGKLWGGIWNKIFRRKFIQKWKVAFPNERLVAWEDWVFLLKFLSHNPVAVYKPVAGYHYWLRPQSAIRSSYSRERFLSSVKTQQMMEDILQGLGCEDLLNRRRVEIKAAAYSENTVPDADFYSVFPEVKSIKILKRPFWHRLFYWLAVHGFRKYVLWFLFRVRRIRRINV